MNKKRLLLISILAVILSACGSSSPDNANASESEPVTISSEDEPQSAAEPTNFVVDDLAALLESNELDAIIGFSEFRLTAIDGETETVSDTPEFERLLRVGKYDADDGSTPISISFDIFRNGPDSGGILADRSDGTVELLSLMFPEVDGFGFDVVDGGPEISQDEIDRIASIPGLSPLFSGPLTISEVTDTSFTLMSSDGATHLFERLE